MSIEKAYELQANTLIKKMEARQFEATYCATKEDAYKKVLSYLTPGCSVSCGGSESLKELGINAYLEKEDGKSIHYINRDLAKDYQSKREVFSKAALADYYLMSTNAFTKNGELVNIDGVGNRVAALSFGPENVIIVVSMNKMTDDVESAIERTRTHAATPNCIRLHCDTVCSKTGFCGNCLMPDCICSQIVVTRFSRMKNRIKVILVGEALGY